MIYVPVSYTHLDVYKRQELVAPGTPIMNLVVVDDIHVVLNVREDLMPQFKMDETSNRTAPTRLSQPWFAFIGTTPAISLISPKEHVQPASPETPSPPSRSSTMPSELAVENA